MSLTPNRNKVVTGKVTRDYYRVNNVGPNPPPVFNEDLGIICVISKDAFQQSSVSTVNFDGLKPFQLPINNYNMAISIIDSPKVVFTDDTTDAFGTTFTKVYANWEVGGLTGDMVSSATADDPTQKVISKLIEQIGTAKADAATSMAELGKTAAHLADTARRVAGALLALKRGRFGDFANAIRISYTTRDVQIYNRRWAKAVREDGSRKVKYDKLYRERGVSRVTDLVADTWLEYSYGWKPLLSDLYGLAEATAQSLVERQGVLRYQTAKGTNRKQSSASTATVATKSSYRFDSERSTAIGVKFAIPAGSLSFAHAFGLSNPLTVAWEIVPFSFVVDWFLPVGDALRGLSAFNGLSFHSGWITRKTKFSIEGEVTLTSYISGGWPHIRGGTAKGRNYDFVIKRDQLFSFPSYGFPEWKDPRSFAHAASAIALLQSLFLRK